MTNKERFKRAFSELHTSDDFVLDLEDKTMTRKFRFRKAAIAACTALAICAGGITCYAANIGDIQRTIQVWLHGDQTTATVTVGEDNITHYSIKDENGNVVEYGGGVAGDGKGGSRPLTESEIEEYLNGPSTDTIDGKLYLFYKDQKVDLTDKFDKDGLCYITLEDGDKKLYVTVAKNGGLQYDEDRYPEKNELPKEWFEEK